MTYAVTAGIGLAIWLRPRKKNPGDPVPTEDEC